MNINELNTSGVQTFEYGKLGELIKNIHTFVVPGGETYTFAMNWTYDSWNRLQNITYPDGEVVSYRYNKGGQLFSVEGTKTTRSYDYINFINYDKYGNRLSVEYGNGTSSKYTYDQTTLRLSNLKSYNINGEQMQNINYTYDNVSNITQIENDAPVMSNGLGGTSRYNYAYDDIYRLETSTGNWENKNFSLAMQYSASGNIINKTQYAQTSINGRAVTINYSREYNYNGSQPHAISDINNQDLMFLWDANGNMTKYTNSIENIDRTQCWDEENRLTSVNDSKYLSNYLYDAAGERVWKLGGQVQQMLINNEEYVNFADMNENKTLYANPYMVINDREYTKHYYIEGQRIASKIGAGLSPSIVPYTDQIEPINAKYDDITDALLNMCYRADGCVGFDYHYASYGNEFLKIKKLAEYDNAEPDLFFYHSDHIGSSSFITDVTGIASQHLQFLPFGEIFLEQRSTANYHTPYKFSGKEKDEETSYSYFGARYYMSDVSVWLSVDPLADDAPGWTPYRYCFNNPINLIDPNGMSEGNPDWAEGTDKNGKPQIYWVDGPKDVKPGDKYLGKETSEYQEDGKRTDYKADGTIITGVVSLPPVTIYGFRGSGAVCRAMEKSMNQGYDPNWINSFNNCKIIPDYIGVTISGTVIPGGGFGGNGTFGYVRGDGGFLNLSLDEGFGFDVSWGVSISAGYYRGVGKPTAKSLSGVSAYQNYGSVLNFTSWQDISSKDHTLRLGTNWVGGTAKVSFGSKTIFGGSVGTTLTTKPLMLW